MDNNVNTQFAEAEATAIAIQASSDHDAQERDGCVNRIAALLGDCVALLTSEPAIRARAALAMSRLGDPRFHGPELLCLPKDDMLGFVEIKADPHFKIGTRSEKQRTKVGATDRLKVLNENEVNDATTPTPNFHIARYPVTVAQFRAYVDASGQPPLDTDALRGAPIEPVRYVTWDEAHAYCEWLNACFLTPAYEKTFKNNKIWPLVHAGQRFMLPSELEWEKAARGGTETDYPWDDDESKLPRHANVPDSGIGSASVCGCFPPNAYGLHDMISNVFEWTRSVYAPYGQGAFDGAGAQVGVKGLRVVRGGAYNFANEYARCASRRKTHPVFRYNNHGFRVVLRSALM